MQPLAGVNCNLFLYYMDLPFALVQYILHDRQGFGVFLWIPPAMRAIRSVVVRNTPVIEGRQFCARPGASRFFWWSPGLVVAVMVVVVLFRCFGSACKIL